MEGRGGWFGEAGLPLMGGGGLMRRMRRVLVWAVIVLLGGIEVMAV